MQTVRISRKGVPAPATTRRSAVAWTARLAAGAALMLALAGPSWVQPAAAQDNTDTITLGTQGGAQLTVSPGHADAVSTVAEAHASPGHAETIAAAARAVADCVDGAMTQGAAALAVAHPDEGALTQSALTEISASNQSDGSGGQGAYDASQDGGSGGNQGATYDSGSGDAYGTTGSDMSYGSNDGGGKPIRKIVENKCHQEKKQPPKEVPAAPEAPPVEEAPPAPPVEQLPVTGSGAPLSLPLACLLAIASAAAALGAVVTRSRGGSLPFMGTTLIAELMPERD